MKKSYLHGTWWIVCAVLIACTVVIADNIYCAAVYTPEGAVAEAAAGWEEQVERLEGGGAIAGAAAPAAAAPAYTAGELEMLACVIYQEAGADYVCDGCRRRVADVVLNRVADPRFPDTIEGVLTQKRQYGRFYWTGVVWPARAELPQEAHAVERAYRIAREVLEGQHSELYGEGYIWQAEFKQGTGHIRCCGIVFGK